LAAYQVAYSRIGVARDRAANTVYTTQTTLGYVASRVSYDTNCITRGLEEVADRAVESAKEATTAHHVVAAIAAATVLATAVLAADITTRLGHFFY
ncbi:MAG: hypothetical protein EB170_08955, partial [Nitrosopumilaceae archaeon]|nr:hypothetical protein [Nitrosopumilaceae archaeon]